MSNIQKYVNLTDYSIILGRSIKKFDTVFWAKPPKQMGSFNVTLMNLITIINNIKAIEKMRIKMRSLASLDDVAVKDNKSAKKVAEQISSIKDELKKSYITLQDDFFKTLDIAGKQCREVSRAIKDRDDKSRFTEVSKDFEQLVYEAKMDKSIVPIGETDEFLKLQQEQSRKEHKEQEKQINENTDFQLEDVYKLGKALDALTAILATSKTDDLSKQVRKEVAQIKKVLPPKTISISRDGLERLRHSSHLILDLEQISEIMQTTYGFTGSDGKLQKINKQIESLQVLLEQALKEEKERKSSIKQERDVVQGRINYATEAVKTYGDILSSNSDLEQEQIRIRNDNHSLNVDNNRLRTDLESTKKDALEIQGIPEENRGYDDNAKLQHLLEKQEHDRSIISDNERYMDSKMKEQVITALPSSYINMKKKLQNISSLYQVQMQESQELSNGGKSR